MHGKFLITLLARNFFAADWVCSAHSLRGRERKLEFLHSLLIFASD